MKRLQPYLSLLIVVALVASTSGLEGCSSKEKAPVVGAQAQQTSAPSGQPAPVNQAQMQLPELSLSPNGLDELLAPIALYPDPVLAVMLQAAVDPQEVMDGGNWLVLDQNQNLKEAALDEASKKAGFTPVMQALLHYPTVVDLMCTQFDWTKQLGAAYQANPKAVLDSVQRLRAQAVDNGALKSSPQMRVDVKQDNGRQVVELKPADPKVVYVPQYNPGQVYGTATTTTTTSGGTTTTTTTTTGAVPTSSSSTVVVQEQKSGVSTGTAATIGLLSFGAGILLGAAINKNNYYYPAWGYGGVWYGPRPYYPPPYHPVYYPGWGPGYGYNRPVHYGNTYVYINNSNNYYNRFNNNNNLNPNYRPQPVPYNNKPNGVYANSMGNQPNSRPGVSYRPSSTGNVNNQPGSENVQSRPGRGNVASNANVAQRPAPGKNANNWKGQTTYQGRTPADNANRNVQTPGGGNLQARPAPQPGNVNPGSNSRLGAGNALARNPPADRGFGQPSGTRPTTLSQPPARPSITTNQPASRPATNQPAARPATPNQPAARPALQPANRQQPSGGGAFSGANNAKADRAASNRGHASMGAPASRPAPAGRKR